MTIRVSKDRIDMDDKILQKPVLKDYGETCVGGASGTTISGGSSIYYLDFDGVNDVVTCGTSISLANVSFSVAVWAKRDTASAADYILGVGTAVNYNGLHFGFRDADTFTFAFYGADLDVTSATYATDTNWHHWAGTYNATTNERIIYRDGEEVARDTAVADFQGSGTFRIGTNYAGADYFDGGLDNIYVYTRVLTPYEVQTLANDGTISTTSLAANWRMNQGSGTSLTDSSGNGNTGTISGATWVAGGPSYEYVSHTINCQDGNVHHLLLASDCAITFANPPASGTFGSLTVVLTQDGTGGRVVAWPSAVKWEANSGKPVLSTAASAADIFTFTTTDGGATWTGYISGLDMKAPPTISLSYVTSAYDSTSLTTYTHSSVSIGAADSSRRIILCVSGGGGTDRTISSLTVGGIAATNLVSANAANQSETPSIWIAAVPTGTTANIVVTFSGSGATSNTVSVYRVTGLTSNSAYDTATKTTATSDTLRATVINVPKGGFVIAMATGLTTGTAINWFGATEDYDSSNEVRQSTASISGLSAETGRTVGFTGGGTSNGLVVASFGPQPYVI